MSKLLSREGFTFVFRLVCNLLVEFIRKPFLTCYYRRGAKAPFLSLSVLLQQPCQHHLLSQLASNKREHNSHKTLNGGSNLFILFRKAQFSQGFALELICFWY